MEQLVGLLLVCTHSNFEVFKPDAHCLRLNRVTLESLEIFNNQVKSHT